MLGLLLEEQSGDTYFDVKNSSMFWTFDFDICDSFSFSTSSLPLMRGKCLKQQNVCLSEQRCE